MWYNRLNDHLKKRFGQKIYKISLSAGMTCPNRDGTAGFGGCIFCSEKGSGEFSEKGDIINQIRRGKEKVASKIKDGKYIAYFQSFTNTYGDTDYLRQVFFEAINHEDVAVLSIATRPDCLEDDKIELIRELAGIKPVWVELGLQTSNEKTAEYIRRRYENSVYENAVARLHEAGAEVITHMIIGLPGETPEDAVATARYIGDIGSDGIKIHSLYIVKGTDLEREYIKGAVALYTMEEYTRILGRCIEVLPPEVVIHRITGDGAKISLVAPMWTADKKKVLNYINKYFEEKDITQGKKH